MISEDLLDAIEAYLEKHCDIVDGEFGPLPNKAMVLLVQLQQERETK